MASKHVKRVTGVAIRDDGFLYPATDQVLRAPNFRPYHGDVNASLEERLRYLQGFSNRNAAAVAAEQGTFNIGTAGKDELLEFVLNEFGKQLDGRKSLEKLRNEAILLVQDSALPAAA